MRYKHLFISLVLIASCFLVYANSLHNAFVSDDIPVIVENAHREAVLPYWSSPADMLYSLNYRMGHLDPFVYHLTNLILHALNTILVYIFLRLLFSTTASMIGALLFGVHPIHTEAVTWISGRPYEIIGMSLLVGYILYQYALNREATGGRVKAVVYGTVVGLYQYFLISFYPFWMLFPILLVVSDVTFGKWRKNWKYWIPFLLLLFVRFFLLRGYISYRISNVAADAGAGSPNIFYNFINSLSSYTQLLLWPAKLTFYHNILITSLFQPRLVIACIVIICACVFAATKYKELFFAFIVFILFLAPTYSPFLVTALLAERYAYFASISLSIALAFLCTRAPGLRIGKRPLVLLVGVILLTLSARTMMRNRDWKDADRFWSATLAASPESPQAHNNMGIVYAERGSTEEALQEYRQAIAINPFHKEAYYNIGNLYDRLGRKAEAVEYLNKAIEVDPENAAAYNNLGMIRNGMGQTDNALEMFEKAIRIKENYAEPYNNIGTMYAARGDLEKARVFFKEAARRNPAFAVAFFNIGVTCQKSGKEDEAAMAYEKAVEIDAGYGVAHNNLALIYLHQKKLPQCARHAAAALKSGYPLSCELSEFMASYR